MDSRLLNVFHEDPFEGNFAKYDVEPNFWSPDDDLQLSDTLNGILPIEPTDESLLSPNGGVEELQNKKNLLIYSDFVEQQLSDQDVNVLNAQVYQAITDSEVDVAYEQQRHLNALVKYDRDDVGLDDIQSQCSNSTFRTRTDSSSIGDYESHSSDYDDDDEYNELDQRLLTADEIVSQSNGERKSRTMSTNTISSDADALGLNIDVNNFDLADFITKDDFAENLNTFRVKELKPTSPCAPGSSAIATAAAAPAGVALAKPAVVASTKTRDSDEDSDSIIDVETIDVIDVDESVWVAGQAAAADDLCYVDNVKADPSWCPKSIKKPVISVKEAKPMQTDTLEVAPALTPKSKPNNNICLVPNKKQSEFLKRKVGASMHKSPKVATKKEAPKPTTKKQQSTIPSQAAIAAPGTGLGLGGKNLALLKHEREAAAASTAAAVSPQIESQPKTAPTPTPVPAPTPAPKRKLNLEEYKQRRCGGVITKPKCSPPKQAKFETAPAAVDLKPVPIISTQKLAIVNIVNSLKCPNKEPAAVPMDPITVAKNKVLRMLEMKRAQQLKIIDSRVTAKVPRVTKLPPLKDIVKDTYCMETEAEPDVPKPKNKLNADYEEIIIVSASCNTDITIPPNQICRTSSRSLLKSSVLLYNISNGQDANKNKNMSNSLIASIQCEVVKQTSCAAVTTAPSSTTAPPAPADQQQVQHGEDMIIMHLPKDRVRKQMVSMATQTELQPEFPLLSLPTVLRQSRGKKRRNYRKRRNESSASDSSDGSCSLGGSSSASSSLASYKTRSRSNSTEQLRNSEAIPVCGGSSIGNGYSSRSTHRHRSSVSSSSYSEAGKYERRQRRTSYNKRRSKNQTARANLSTSGSEYSDRERSRSPQRSLRRSRSRSTSNNRCNAANNSNNSNALNNNRRGFVDRNVSQPAVEERRIVYVGRIEPETTKELLRRKFLPYGSIKQITIHYKENGMKYGFVTYEHAQDAFTAIDTSPRDAQINMYDISFGGRRAFCRASYADLDNAGINNYHSYVFPKVAAPVVKPQDDSFEALLLKVKAKMNAGKPAAATSLSPEAAPPSAAQAVPATATSAPTSFPDKTQI